MLSKNILKFQKLSDLPYFTVGDLAEEFNIQPESASVLCSRYAKQGLLVKLKNNYYSARQKLKNIGREDLFAIANIVQVPSYISFMTAMSYYELTTQLQRNFVESASVKRTIEYSRNGTELRYYKMKKQYYFDFTKENGIFIATKEKSFIDAMYLYSFGKYKFDLSSIDISKLDKSKLLNLVKVYPDKTKKIVIGVCRI